MNSPLGGLSLAINITLIFCSVLFKMGRGCYTALMVYLPSWRSFRPSEGGTTTSRTLRSLTQFHATDHALPASIIIGCVITVYLFILTIFLTNTMSGKNNYTALYYDLKTCQPLTPSQPTEHTIVLRLDDVQAYAWTDISIEMMSAARARNMPIVAGIIPYNIDHNWDLEKYFTLYGCTIESAVHGYRHKMTGEGEGDDREFADLSYAEASALLKSGTSALKKVGVVPSATFIPPTNLISDQATIAVHDSGFRIISANNADSYGFDVDLRHDIESNATTTTRASCMERWELQDSLCVVMMHPQDLSTTGGSLDPEKFARYIDFLDEVAADPTVSVVTFEELPR
jgi:predicted deacetylase